jgi:hypothetical protein
MPRKLRGSCRTRTTVLLNWSLLRADVGEKRTAAPWMTEEELGRYATGMLAELERAARGKQERTRPGTLERS